MEMTEFQKVKQKEWDDFSKANPNNTKKLIIENIGYLICGILILFFMFTPSILQGGEWNDKPIMCADEQETFSVINLKEEDLIFTATQITKVRTASGLAKNPVGVKVLMYVNPEKGTYTVVEYHPTYKSYCVISFGTNFQVFIGGVQ